jgi:ABC-type antimicrobial peptide transport system ATPase subunit
MNDMIVTPLELEPEDDILAYTHSKRRDIVNTLTAKGVPDDPDVIKILLTTLKDMDSQTINRKRIKVDEKTNDVQAQSAAVIAKILSSMTNVTANATLDISAEYRVIPSLPDSIAAPVLVAGETDLIAATLTYGEFLEKYNDEDA